MISTALPAARASGDFARCLGGMAAATQPADPQRVADGRDRLALVVRQRRVVVERKVPAVDEASRPALAGRHGWAARERSAANRGDTGRGEHIVEPTPEVFPGPSVAPARGTLALLVGRIGHGPMLVAIAAADQGRAAWRGARPQSGIRHRPLSSVPADRASDRERRQGRGLANARHAGGGDELDLAGRHPVVERAPGTRRSARRRAAGRTSHDRLGGSSARVSSYLGNDRIEDTVELSAAQRNAHYVWAFRELTPRTRRG